MNIKIDGYKNLTNLTYDIKDKQTNFLFGLCGSGKSAIGNALVSKGDIQEYDVQINYGKEPVIKINDSNTTLEATAIFNSQMLSKYIIDRSVDNDMYNLFIDTEDSEYAKSAKDLEALVNGLKSCLNSYNDLYNNLNDIKNRLGAKLTQKGELSKTSILSKAKTAFNNASNKRIFKKIKNFDKTQYKWILDGEKYIVNKRCPFCGKKLSIKKRDELNDYIKFDTKIVSTFDLSENEKNLIKLKRSPLIKSEIDKICDKSIEISKATSEYEHIVNLLNDLTDFDKKFDKNAEIIVDDALYSYFPKLRSPINQYNLHLNDISEISKAVKDNTKSILLRKLNYINSFLKNVSIPYMIVAEKKKNRIDSYKIVHVQDKDGISRENCLSEGEKVVISLILFLLEEQKKQSQLIIIDDPVSSFDDVRRGAIFYIIETLLKGKTVLLLSHDPVFAKYAVLEKFKQEKKEFDIGNIDYFDNYRSHPIFIPINKDDINSFDYFVKKHLQGDLPEFIKAINCRLCLESMDRPSASLANRAYSYFSSICHCKLKSAFKNSDLEKENKIIDLIENHLSYQFKPFSNDEIYKNIKIKGLTTFDKAILLRCMIDFDSTLPIPNEVKNSLNDFIHLNSRYIMCLNPYKFDFSTPAVREAIELFIDTQEFITLVDSIDS